MTVQRRSSLSQRFVKKLTAEEVSALNALDARRKQPRYPLDLTATLASNLLSHGVPDTSDRAPYIEAARRAIMLLDVCREELLRDADAQVSKEAFAAQASIAVEERRKLEREYRNGVVPFRRGLLWITRRSSLTDAQPVFKRWRLYLHQHPEAFPHVARDNGANVEASIINELEQYRRVGFGLDTLEALRADFTTWYDLNEVPDVRARAGRAGGTRSRRRKRNA